jgi:hypothetical protein
MDAKEYDRIADLLMQIRMKYSQITCKDTHDQHRLTYLIHSLDHLLKMNDLVAERDTKGYL